MANITPFYIIKDIVNRTADSCIDKFTSLFEVSKYDITTISNVEASIYNLFLLDNYPKRLGVKQDILIDILESLALKDRRFNAKGLIFERFDEYSKLLHNQDSLIESTQIFIINIAKSLKEKEKYRFLKTERLTSSSLKIADFAIKNIKSIEEFNSLLLYVCNKKENKTVYFFNHLFFKIDLTLKKRIVDNKRGVFISLRLINSIAILVFGYLLYKNAYHVESPNYFYLFTLLLATAFFGYGYSRTSETSIKSHKKSSLHACRYAFPRKVLASMRINSRTKIKPYFPGYYEIDFLRDKKTITELIKVYEYTLEEINRDYSHKNCLEETKNKKNFYYQLKCERYIQDQINFLKRLKTIID